MLKYTVQRAAELLHVPPALFYILVLVTLALLTAILAFVLHKLFHRWSRRLEGSRSKLTVQVLDSLVLPLLVLGVLYTAVHIVSLPASYQHVVDKGSLTIVIGIVFFFLSKATLLLLQAAAQKEPALVKILQPAGFFVHIAFGFLALIIVLENLGVSLTAVWTTLGVGSVAVGLGLQTTLGNFFAGINLFADHPFRPGDHVKLSSGDEGEVLRIGWRATVLESASKDVIFVPNSVMTTTVFRTRPQPARSSSLTIPVKVNYRSDLDKIERTMLDAVKEVSAHRNGVLPEPGPRVLITSGMGDPTVELSLTVNLKEGADKEGFESELRKRLLHLYRSGEIPAPGNS